MFSLKNPFMGRWSVYFGVSSADTRRAEWRVQTKFFVDRTGPVGDAWLESEFRPVCDVAERRIHRAEWVVVGAVVIQSRVLKIHPETVDGHCRPRGAEENHPTDLGVNRIAYIVRKKVPALGEH